MYSFTINWTIRDGSFPRQYLEQAVPVEIESKSSGTFYEKITITSRNEEFTEDDIFKMGMLVQSYLKDRGQ